MKRRATVVLGAVRTTTGATLGGLLPRAAAVDLEREPEVDAVGGLLDPAPGELGHTAQPVLQRVRMDPEQTGRLAPVAAVGEERAHGHDELGAVRGVPPLERAEHAGAEVVRSEERRVGKECRS